MKRNVLSIAAMLAAAAIASSAFAVCDNCGTVTAVKKVKKEAAGQPAERNRNATTSYVVEVRLDNGAMRTFTYSTATAYKAGDHVKIVDKKLVRQ